MRRFARRVGTGCLTLALVAGMAAGVALTTQTPAHAESNGGTRVVPVGDSITDGAQVPGGYRIELWQRLVAGGYAPLAHDAGFIRGRFPLPLR